MYCFVCRLQMVNPFYGLGWEFGKDAWPGARVCRWGSSGLSPYFTKERTTWSVAEWQHRAQTVASQSLHSRGGAAPLWADTSFCTFQSIV